MATNNFEPVNFELPLIVYGMGDDYEERKKEWEEENGGEYEYNDDLYESDIDCECEFVEEELREFNENLEFFKIEQKSGYYAGIQFQVEWDNNYDYDTAIEMEDEEETKYWYDYTPSELKKNIQGELETIKQYLMKLSERMGYLNLYKYAQFSNGEAIYRKVGE